MANGRGPRGNPRNRRHDNADGGVTGGTGSRVTKRTPARGGSAQRSGRTNVQKAYTPCEYPLKEMAYFDTIQSWEDGKPKLVDGIKRLRFCGDFPVTDAHIDAIIAIGPSFCHSLLDFRAGDSETGEGGILSDVAVIRFANACPNLVHVSIDGATNLTDDSLLAFFTNCPSLRYVCLSGNDNSSGKLNGSALKVLKETPAMGKELVKLRLTDHGWGNEKLNAAVKKLSAARKKLPIEVGNTHETAGELNTWLGGKEKYGFQPFGATGGFRQAGFKFDTFSM